MGDKRMTAKQLAKAVAEDAAAEHKAMAACFTAAEKIVALIGDDLAAHQQRRALNIAAAALDLGGPAF